YLLARSRRERWRLENRDHLRNGYRGRCRRVVGGAELRERSLVGGASRAARNRDRRQGLTRPGRVGCGREPGVEQRRGLLVAGVGGAEDDNDQRAPVTRGRRDQRVLRAVGEAGLEADRPWVVVAPARQHLVVVDQVVLHARGIDERVLVHRRPFRDLGHRERVAGRDGEVVRAHERTALVRRLVVEAG